MQKAGRFARWLLVQAAFTGALWFGTVGGHEGAANVARFWAWFVFVVSLGMLSDDIARKAAQGAPSAPVWLMWAANAFVLALMVWHGWFVTATAFLVALLLLGRKPPGEEGATHG